MEQQSIKRVILWTHPRSISTAFERAISNLPKTKTLHEPLGDPYYLGPERKSTRYEKELPDENATYQKTYESFQSNEENVELLFVKDMAYFMEGHMNDLLSDGFRGYTHTFLIRDPKKAIPSFYKMATNKELTGWDRFEPIEAGYRQLYEVYDFFCKNIVAGGNDNMVNSVQLPLVIDADDLLDDPVKMTKLYCDVIGVPFKEDILYWPMGEKPANSDWPNGWYENLINSDGLHKRKKDEEKENNGKVDPSLPVEVVSSIDESIPFYDKLYLKRTKC